MKASLFLISYLFLTLASGQVPSPIVYRPFADYQQTGYVVMAGLIGHDSKQQKYTIVQNLPSDVKLILYLPPVPDEVKQMILSEYEQYISPDRVIFMTLPNAIHGFWARDAIPMPIMSTDGQVAFVDAKYWDGFEPDKQIAGLFGMPLLKNSYQFEGGNFLGNDQGDCFIVDNDKAMDIPSSVFKNVYGCLKVNRMPFIKGIGHIDEHMRFVDAHTVMTDLDQYRKTFEKLGFKVLMLPRPKKDMENYVNSLLVNGTVFVPVFGEDTDAQALQVYSSIGWRVIPLDSKVLSNEGEGSYHCITMNIPAIPLAQ